MRKEDKQQWKTSGRTRQENNVLHLAICHLWTNATEQDWPKTFGCPCKSTFFELFWPRQGWLTFLRVCAKTAENF